MRRSIRRFLFSACAVLLPLAALAGDPQPTAGTTEQEASSEGSAQNGPPQLPWQPGPLTAPIGDALAEIELPEGYVFLDRPGTLELLRQTGNLTGESELATIASASDSNWFVIFEWDPSGWVDDADHDKLDADALLASLMEGDRAANEERKRLGLPKLELVGWHEPPHYDAATNNLTWATEAKTEHGVILNRLVKLLGRRGVMSATLVASPDELPAAKTEVDRLLAEYSFVSGNSYAEYLPGTDKAAGYGLGALVVGGVLAKTGLLAKLWKPIAAAAVAAFAGIQRLLGRKKASTPNA